MLEFYRKQRISPACKLFHKTGHVIENDVNVYQQEIHWQVVTVAVVKFSETNVMSGFDSRTRRQMWVEFVLE